MIDMQEMDTTPPIGLWQLPKEWEWIHLGDAFALRTGTLDPSRAPDEIFSLYSMPSYDAGNGPEIVYGREIGSAKILVQKGDILLSKLNPRIPRVWYINEDTSYRKLTSTDFLALVTRSNSSGKPYFDEDFAKYFLLSNIFRSQVTEDIKGATNSRQRIKREDILNSFIPHPPVNVQHYIKNRLEALLANVRDAQKTLESMRQDVDKIIGSALVEVLEELRRSSPTVETIGELISKRKIKVLGGGTPPKEDNRYWGDFRPWVSPKDMKRWYINDTEDHISQLALTEKKIKPIPQGSVLVVVRGMILARHLPVAVTMREVTINQDMKALYCVKNLLPEYLGYILRASAPLILQKVEVAAHGTRRLETNKLENVSIPLPSENIQKRVIAYLDSIQESVNRLQDMIREDKEVLQKIEQSILERAFRGEL